MNPPTPIAILEIYLEAFAEPDPSRRVELLSLCFTEHGEIWGPGRLFSGYADISEKIAGFHNNWPDCRLVLASGLSAFANFVRVANAIVDRKGSVLASGETVVEFSSDGRIARVVPLWKQALPAIPESWPRHLASPAPRDAPNAE